MTRPQTVHAQALYLRTCAAALANGDSEARDQSRKLLAQADKIDPQPRSEDAEGHRHE